MFAVVAVAGKQYKVSPGQVVEVDRLPGKPGDTLTLSEVLLVSDDGKTTVGTPTVKGVSVKAKILLQLKGDKVEVRRFKSKVRYRRVRGFRPQLTKLEIISMGRA